MPGRRSLPIPRFLKKPLSGRKIIRTFLQNFSRTKISTPRPSMNTSPFAIFRMRPTCYA